MSGYLELILGPMFSGKSTYLVQKYREYETQSKTVVAINYVDDKRYSQTDLSTHDLVTIPCAWGSALEDVVGDLDMSSVDVILINEGQFFPDLYEQVKVLVEIHNKRVYVCGLDGDFKRQRFGAILDLIPICDKVIKLRSLCGECSQPALFTHRLSKELDQTVIGSSNYTPLCRTCYITKQ